MGTQSSVDPRRKLLSWKEIASYLVRDVRTVQRWNADRGLPVHRIPGGKGASVFAYTEELEDWLRRDSQRDILPPVSSPDSLPENTLETDEGREVPRPSGSAGWSKDRVVRLSIALGMAAALVFGAVFFSGRGRVRKSPLGDPVRLAVLPFVDLTGDREQEYFSDGLTEEMISQLGGLNPPRLGVIARTSAMTYKHTNKSMDQIGRELGVDYLVEGSVRRSGNRVRITAQLIRASDQTHLWADSYDRDLGDILKLEEEVSRSIAREIQAQLKPPEQLQSANIRPVNAEAYENYLKGRFFLRQKHQTGLNKSIQYFNQAVVKDPNYALAYAGLAESYTLLGLYSVRPSDVMPKAESAAAKALELDGSLAEGHAALAGVRALYDWDWRGAEREFKRAMDLNPAYAEAHHLYATLYCAPLGRKQETIEHMELALKLDPLSPIITTDRGWAYFLAGQTDRAMAEYHAALYLDSSFAPAMDRLSQAYEQNGDFKDALWWNDQNAEYPNDVKTAMERAYSRAGYRGALQEQLEMMTKLVKSGAVEDPYSFAFVYAKLGENDRALEQLEKAYEERHPGMVYIKVDPPFETLRGNARLQSLERRVGLVP